MSPALIEAIIVAGIKYGPAVAQAIIDLFKKETVSISDIETLFASIKKYEDFGIDESKGR